MNNKIIEEGNQPSVISALQPDKTLLAQFYNNNSPVEIPIIGNPNIMTYNVHMMRDLMCKPVNKNTDDIYKLVAQIRPEIVFFQEHPLKCTWPKGEGNGYYWISVPNGTPINYPPQLYLTVCSKQKYDFTVIDTSGSRELIISHKGYFAKYQPHRRNQILLSTPWGKIVGVHLDIGLRLTNNDVVNQKIMKINSQTRIKQLEKILEFSPDIIMGDFNFTSDDNEFEYLKNNGYISVDSSSTSTPYNRVDFVFVKNNVHIGKQYLLKCNYSDHLPLVQVLNDEE